MGSVFTENFAHCLTIKHFSVKETTYKDPGRICRVKHLIQLDLVPNTLLSTTDDCSKLAKMENRLSLLKSSNT